MVIERMSILNFSKELERFLAHTWCHNVRQDYILDRLWNGEQAVQVSLGMGLRQWLDPYKDIRVWFEVYHKKEEKGQKKVDLEIVRLTQDYEEQRIYYDMDHITHEILLLCELKYGVQLNWRT